MDTLNNIVLTIQHYLADYILIVALFCAGIWFSIQTKFIQVRGFKRGESLPLGGQRHRGDFLPVAGAYYGRRSSFSGYQLAGDVMSEVVRRECV